MLGDLNALNEDVSSIIKSVNDLAVSTITAIKQPKQPAIPVTPYTPSRNWTPWLIGGGAALLIAAVVMKVGKKKQ